MLFLHVLLHFDLKNGLRAPVSLAQTRRGCYNAAREKTALRAHEAMQAERKGA